MAATAEAAATAAATATARAAATGKITEPHESTNLYNLRDDKKRISDGQTGHRSAAAAVLLLLLLLRCSCSCCCCCCCCCAAALLLRCWGVVMVGVFLLGFSSPTATPVEPSSSNSNSGTSKASNSSSNSNSSKAAAAAAAATPMFCKRKQMAAARRLLPRGVVACAATLLCLAAAAAAAATAAATAAEVDLAAADTVQNFPLQRLAFGSCFKQQRQSEAAAAAAKAAAAREAVFAAIQRVEPQAWLWIGDAGYSEGFDVGSVRKAFDAVNRTESYGLLKDSLLFLDGTWDDHDFGMNDGGRNQRDIDKLQEAFLDFLGIAPDSPRRNRRGVYSSHLFPLPVHLQQQQQQQQQRQQQQQQQQGEGVRVLLLDTRSHRDSHFIPSLGMLSLTPPFSFFCAMGGAASRFLVHLLGLGYDYEGDILGEEQWTWLEAQLRHSKARVHLLGGVVEFTSSGMTHSLGDTWLVRHLVLPLLRWLYTSEPRRDVFSSERNFGFIEFNYPQQLGNAAAASAALLQLVLLWLLPVFVSAAAARCCCSPSSWSSSTSSSSRQPVEVLVSSHSAETGEVLFEETIVSDSISWQQLHEATPDVVGPPSPMLLLLLLLLLLLFPLLLLRSQLSALLHCLRMRWLKAYRPLPGPQAPSSSSSSSSSSEAAAAAAAADHASSSAVKSRLAA
ncbi:hypothetical protein Emed_004634 [Eimeria media]